MRRYVGVADRDRPQGVADRDDLQPGLRLILVAHLDADPSGHARRKIIETKTAGLAEPDVEHPVRDDHLGLAFLPDRGAGLGRGVQTKCHRQACVGRFTARAGQQAVIAKDPRRRRVLCEGLAAEERERAQ